MNEHMPGPADLHTIIFDFDGVFTDNKVWVDRDGRESVQCDRADGLALNFLRKARHRGDLDAEVFILSSESDLVVQARAAKLRLDCHHGVSDKLAFVAEYLDARFPDDDDPFAGVAFLGNDLNDLPLLRRVGWSVAPSDAHPAVRSVVGLVLDERGGESFVRRFVERMLGLDQMTEDRIDEFVSDR